MANYSTYQGQRLNLEAYKGKASIDYEIEVFKNDGSPFDFSIYTSLGFKVYYRKHGEFIVSLSVVENASVLLLDITMAQSNALQLREYWYECYGIFPDTQEELITFGTFKVV